MNIAILGSGNVGSALAKPWLAAGHNITFAARDPKSVKTVKALEYARGAVAGPITEGCRNADAILLAVPYLTAADALAAAGDLDGQLIIDATNPYGPNLSYKPGTAPSGAEEILSHFPGLRIVKAFNTVGSEVMKNPRYGGLRAVMHYCGDDELAKQTVAGLILEVGFDPVDAGPLRAAYYLENLALLWIHMAMVQGAGREYAYALLNR